MKLFTSLLLITSLTGCMEVPTYQDKEMILEVTKIDPPKYFRLHFKSSSGDLVHAYSKRCSEYRKVKVGDKYKLPVTILGYKDGTTDLIINVSACKIVREYKKVN